MAHVEQLTKLQYSNDRTGPWKLYIFEPGSEYRRGGSWFVREFTDRYEDEMTIHEARKHAEDKERRRQDRRGQDDPAAVEAAGRQAADTARPKDKAQANFTDPDSRIMKNSDGAYIQAYNAQAVVDEKHQVITAADITTNASDALNYTPMLDQSAQNTGAHPKQALVDAGYCSETNLEAANSRKPSQGLVDRWGVELHGTLDHCHFMLPCGAVNAGAVARDLLNRCASK